VPTRNLPVLRESCPVGTCAYVSCRHHLAIYKIQWDGSIVWHSLMGQDPEALSEVELGERLESLPYGGCTLKAADEGGLVDARVADVLGYTYQSVQCLSITAEKSFRAASRLLLLDFL
jgi:hypothetical protein